MEEELIKEINSLFTEVYGTKSNYILMNEELNQDDIDKFCPDFENDPEWNRIHFLEIVSNEEPPGLHDGGNCEKYDTKEEALAKLRINLLTYVQQEIMPEAKRKVIFWRIKPEIEKRWDWRYPEKWHGYTRIGIFCQ